MWGIYNIFWDSYQVYLITVNLCIKMLQCSSVACLRTTDRFLYLCLFSVVFSSLLLSILRLSADLYAFNLFFVALPVTTMRRNGKRETDGAWNCKEAEQIKMKMKKMMKKRLTVS